MVPDVTQKKMLSIVLDRRHKASLQEQLSIAIRRCIQTGALTAGEFLPSSREFAKDLSVSRNTVVAAYDRLLGEGYLEAEPKRGVYVRQELDSKRIGGNSKFPIPDAQHPTLHHSEAVCRPPLPFRPCQPDVGLFPIALWNRMRTRAMKKLGDGLLHYQSRFALGVPSLRFALAEYLSKSRGVRCEWKQIAITGGSQQALFLLAQLLVKTGDRVLLEEPGYPGARQAMEHAGARVQTMSVDEQGVIPPETPRAARIIYTTPSRQFPTGACLPVARRLAMLSAAKQANAWLIEDDYDSEFRYTRPPLPSLHSLDSTGRVIYLGSMSKVLFPSLRIGYLVLPQELVSAFESLRWIVDDHGPLIDQATLAEFISAGAFYTHIRRCRKAYANKMEVFLDSAEKHRLPMTFPFTDGGMNLMGYFEDVRTDANLVSQTLADHGLDVPSLSKFSIGKPRSGLVFGFTAFDHKTIQHSVAKIANVLRAGRFTTRRVSEG
jgi:GntR family transcriptional regulator / MocR family aminotransferase